MPDKIFKKTYIIAEAGVNHNGDISLAKQLIDIAASAGADAVKFQTFSADELISESAEQAQYQKKNTGIVQSQLEMVRNLELSKEQFKELYNYSKDKNITFLSTAFDFASMKFLVEECRLPLIKIPSGEITNAPYLFDCARYGLPIILSTGMANLGEIEQSLAVLSYGWVHDKEPDSLQQCLDFYNQNGMKGLKDNITILQCVTQYPAPYSDTNLNAMQTIADKFECKVGFSDHSEGVHIPVAAVALGATIIEKHFTIDKNLPGPDHKASLTPDELKTMVKYIRDTESAFGNGVKETQPSEIENLNIARRSIVAAKNIAAGQVYTNDNIKCKRSNGGISPMLYWDYLNKPSSEDVKIDHVIK